MKQYLQWKQKVWNAYCSIYNIFILDRFLYIFVPYTLRKIFYNIHDANLYQKRRLLRHERRSLLVIVAACLRTASDGFLTPAPVLREERQEHLEMFGIKRFIYVGTLHLYVQMHTERRAVVRHDDTSIFWPKQEMLHPKKPKKLL